MVEKLDPGISALLLLLLLEETEEEVHQMRAVVWNRDGSGVTTEA